MIERAELLARVREALHRSRVVTLLGPRQCGKTTLAREIVPPHSANYFDLEDPAALRQLEQPKTALEHLHGVVVIDEVQRRPELFPLLRVLCDRKPLPARFLILGSASPALIRSSSESLTGRMETVVLGGFGLPEIAASQESRLWLRGGLPPSFLARNDADSAAWRKSYVQTVVERDILQLGYGVPSAAMFRFWTMLAHYHGQIWNAAEPARSLGISETSVRRYLDLLDGIFMVRQLLPWHENLKKRQVKSPKIYIRDTGLLHRLLGITSLPELLRHPKCGASWEGFALEAALQAFQPDEAYFWATHNGAELDLLMLRRGVRIGVECKRADAPRLTPSMRTAIKELGLSRLWVIYPGRRRFALADKVAAVPLSDLRSGRLAFSK